MATFYENQQEARRKTGLLAFYFGLAVVLITLAVDVVLFLTERYGLESRHVMGPAHNFNLNAFNGFLQWLTGLHGLVATLLTLAVLATGSIVKTLVLGKSGDQVAIMAGGTWVDLDTTNPKERQLLNVVEEMAIASGIKPPRVYLLREEAGINAFVAGLTPNDSALAVTQGALDQLTRDELQGVIGHEFSHILNSDMRINVRMIGLLAGILMIGQIGRVLIDSRSRSVSSSRKGSNALPLVGIALWLIGSMGLFFGQLIKAALSRQREFLADASSVQFTRNPLGIGGALLKIRDASQHSYLVGRHADDISHMCFGEVMTHRFNALFATHPPLDERIRAIDPQLEKRLQAIQAQEPNAQRSSTTPTKGWTGKTFDSALPDAASGFAAISAASLKASVGKLSEPQIALGERLHAQLPEALLLAAHDTEDAPTLLYALVLAAPQQDASVNQALKELFPAPMLTRLMGMRSQIMAMPLNLRLPLLDLIIPTLQHFAAPERAGILTTLQSVIRADKRYSLSECAYFLLTEKYLCPRRKTAFTINSIHKVESQVLFVFSALAHISRADVAVQRKHFEHTLRCLGFRNASESFDQMPTANQLMDAVHTLTRLSPLLKQSLIDNAVDMVIADGQIHLAEIELLRAFCELLDCPMPPVDASQLKQ